MTTRYDCPISACGWFHDYVATPPEPDWPADPLSWPSATWASFSEQTGRLLTEAQVIDAHLSTHPPAEWAAELTRERRRAEDAEAALDRLLDAQDPVSSQRMPTRAEVDAWRPAPASAVMAPEAELVLHQQTRPEGASS